MDCDKKGNNKLLKFYGELSLKYWINLLLEQKIKLPEYQRNFVWEPFRVVELYRSLVDGMYIPPVLIAHKTSKNHDGDYILDGQQRLSAVLLLYLGIYPNCITNGKTLENMLHSENEEFYIDWTIKKLFDYSNFNIENNDKMIESKLYKNIKDKTLYDVWFKKMRNLLKV